MVPLYRLFELPPIRPCTQTHTVPVMGVYSELCKLCEWYSVKILQQNVFEVNRYQDTIPPVTTDYPHICSAWLISAKFDSWTQANYELRITDGDKASTSGVNAPVSSKLMLLCCHYVSLSSTIFNNGLIARQSFHTIPFVAYLLCQIHGPGTMLQMFCNNEMNQFVIVKDTTVIYQTGLSFYPRPV